MSNVDFSELKVGDEYKGVEIASFTETGEPVGVNGRNLHRGYFVKGNKFGKGRKKGSRNKMTQMMLDRVANSRVAPDEFLIDIMSNVTTDEKLRLQAAMKLVDIVYPKASSVEMDLTDNRDVSKEDMDARLKELLSKVADSM